MIYKDDSFKRKTVTSSSVKRRYNSQHYSEIRAFLPKDIVSAFKSKVSANGDSISSVVKKAVLNYLDE